MPTLDEQLMELQDENNDLISDVERLTCDVDDYKQQLESLREQHDEQVSEMDEKIEALNARGFKHDPLEVEMLDMEILFIYEGLIARSDTAGQLAMLQAQRTSMLVTAAIE